MTGASAAWHDVEYGAYDADPAVARAGLPRTGPCSTWVPEPDAWRPTSRRRGTRWWRWTPTRSSWPCSRSARPA